MTEIGFFEEKMRHNYWQQAERIRIFFGYKSPFEYMFKHKPKDITAFKKAIGLVNKGVIPKFHSLAKYFKNKQKLEGTQK